MSFPFELPILDKVSGPEELRKMSDSDLDQVAKELRNEVIEVVSQSSRNIAFAAQGVAHHAYWPLPCWGWPRHRGGALS